MREDLDQQEFEVSVRPGWDEYFMGMAKYIASRSTCITAQVGAVIVKDKRILTTGYNGSPEGLPHCNEQGYCYPGLSQCGKGLGLPSIAIHAEVNAIAQAAKDGISIQGATIYVTSEPCGNCLKALIAAGIKSVVCGKAVRVDSKDEYLKQYLVHFDLVHIKEML